MKAIVTVGVSASGKTTWAEQQNALVISRDNVRRTILEQKFGRALRAGELWSNWKFGRAENEVTDICWNQIYSSATLGQDIIIADTNLNRVRNEQLKAKLEMLCYEVEFKEFPISLEDAWKRDAGRADGVGYIVLAKQYQQWLDYIGRKKYIPNMSKPKAVIFDIDGTLATMQDRGAFDWHKVGNDTVREEVADMARGFRSQGYTIIIMSGRDGVCKQETMKWLDDNSIPLDLFCMRSEGDGRKDSIIKEEMFFQYVAPHYNVRLVVDDRKQVTRMWQDLGLNVADVGRYYEEF